ncbi:hypothetical protein [Methylobacterium sp. Leaf466]|uniref:hypothetical protein n=1 Tax=Methylobacterium sp. Leaf466 TaxID=1736386 RepID=UPI0007020968|nr:hypothetical protein [Methylobacterium sp. Leaf466]KQT82427.1 hypothetical protein ASG59_18720 [Methylobacterium sp. Leaf466]
MTSSLLQVRQALANDFELYCERFCKIRDKSGSFIPFKLNKVQRNLLIALNDQLLRTGKIRMVILKARQQGFSTMMQAYTYWWASFRKTKKAYVVANDLQTTRTLFKQLTDTHKNMDPRLQPKVERSNAKQLHFGDLNTSIELATAGGDAVGRGQTLNMLWASELAFWPDDSAADNLMAILQAVPNTDGSIVVVESTAKGVTGPYYDLYHGAPNNDFETFFAPWYDTAEYTNTDVPVNFGKPGTDGEYTIEETDLREKFDLSDGQLWWRRVKIAEIRREKFLQEYPSVPEDAFQNSGAPVFSSSALAHQRETASPPLRKLSYDGDRDVWEERHKGELTIYHEPVKGDQYYIGVDVAFGGSSGDYSVAQVLDGDRRQVAVYRGHILARPYAKLLYSLGMMYGEAEIVVEVNSIGHTTMDWLSHFHGYSNLWRRTVDTKVVEESTDTLGFVTNLKTKPLVISHLADELVMGGIKINCPVTLDEMRTYIRTGSKKTALEASPGKHDDTVMALALANHIFQGKWTPITVDDSWYVDAY